MRVKQSNKIEAVKIHHEFLLECARNKQITKKSYRVLLYLLTIADSRDLIHVTQLEVSLRISMDKTSVSLAFKNLHEEGIIERFPIGSRIRFAENDYDDFY